MLEAVGASLERRDLEARLAALEARGEVWAIVAGLFADIPEAFARTLPADYRL